MKKYKDVPRYNYTIKDIQKRMDILETLPSSFENNNMPFSLIYHTDETINYVNSIKEDFIKKEDAFQAFFSSLAELTVSGKYKYDIIICLSTIKEVFDSYNIDVLSSFIYIRKLFIENPDADLSIVLRTIANIIEANKDNSRFLNCIKESISEGYYFWLMEERSMLIAWQLCFYEEEKDKKAKEKQIKINDITSKYYEDFKQICK